VSLPGDGIIPGFWPAAWSVNPFGSLSDTDVVCRTMGNIGRAGHGATTDGTVRS
jgi:hypothetical protein